MVFGASSDIGPAVALQLAALGYDLVLAGHDRERLDHAAAQVMEVGSCEAAKADAQGPARGEGHDRRAAIPGIHALDGLIGQRSGEVG